MPAQHGANGVAVCRADSSPPPSPQPPGQRSWASRLIHAAGKAGVGLWLTRWALMPLGFSPAPFLLPAQSPSQWLAAGRSLPRWAFPGDGADRGGAVPQPPACGGGQVLSFSPVLFVALPQGALGTLGLQHQDRDFPLIGPGLFAESEGHAGTRETERPRLESGGVLQRPGGAALGRSSHPRASFCSCRRVGRWWWVPLSPPRHE